MPIGVTCRIYFSHPVACLAAHVRHFVRAFQADQSDAIQKGAADTGYSGKMIGVFMGTWPWGNDKKTGSSFRS